MARNQRHAALFYSHRITLRVRHRIIPKDKCVLPQSRYFQTTIVSSLSLSLPLHNKNKMASSDNLLPQNSRIVQPAFLEKHSNKVRIVSWIDYRLMPTVEAGYSFLCRVVSYRVVSCLLSVSHSLLHHTHILTSYIISCYLFVIHRKTWSNVSAH
jgi:hypothetical protein